MNVEIQKNEVSTDRDARLRRQNCILLNLVWWVALMFLGEAFVFSPLPEVISRNFVGDEHGLFWLLFWSPFAAFLIIQGILHHRTLKRYFPETRHVMRWVVGVPASAFVALIAVLLVLMPFSHL